jgi:hypothetical protein
MQDLLFGPILRLLLGKGSRYVYLPCSGERGSSGIYDESGKTNVAAADPGCENAGAAIDRVGAGDDEDDTCESRQRKRIRLAQQAAYRKRDRVLAIGRGYGSCSKAIETSAQCRADRCIVESHARRKIGFAQSDVGGRNCNWPAELQLSTIRRRTAVCP